MSHTWSVISGDASLSSDSPVRRDVGIIPCIARAIMVLLCNSSIRASRSALNLLSLVTQVACQRYWHGKHTGFRGSSQSFAQFIHTGPLQHLHIIRWFPCTLCGMPLGVYATVRTCRPQFGQSRGPLPRTRLPDNLSTRRVSFSSLRLVSRSISNSQWISRDGVLSLSWSRIAKNSSCSESDAVGSYPAAALACSVSSSR